MVDEAGDPDTKISSIEPIAYTTDSTDHALPAMGIPLVERFDFGTNENGFKRTFPEKVSLVVCWVICFQSRNETLKCQFLKLFLLCCYGLLELHQSYSLSLYIV